MRKRARVCTLSFVAALFVLPAIASADPPTVAITLNGTIGTHEETTGKQTLPFIPAPVLQVDAPFKRFEIFVEGLPPIGPVQFAAPNTSAIRGTRLSYGYAALRYHFAGDRFALGIGETLYNQQTTYTQSNTETIGFGFPPQPGQTVTITSTAQEVDSSRVAGARYEAAYVLARRPDETVDVLLAVTPTMHAEIHEDLSFAQSCPRVQNFFCNPPAKFSENGPETGSEIDGQVRWRHRLAHVTLIYGLRYINYVAQFDRSHRLADRNTLVMPFVGLGVPLGR